MTVPWQACRVPGHCHGHRLPSSAEVAMSYPGPKYTRTDGAVSATLRRHDQPAELVYPSGVEVHYLATGASTSGEFGLYRWDFAPGRGGPDPHSHRTIAAPFFILPGTASAHDATRLREATPCDHPSCPAGRN